ncbi:ubiquitin-associated domain-containing protein 1-like [Clavelina lepadiformis]|uniref:ubiquitin-associated domain-containing protein 1-like n=1 Tax=Clavelina lepadiformis TaxID=159417 RepID=UPI0040411B21
MDTKAIKSSLNCSVGVSDLYGNDTSVNVSPDMLIEKIKEMAIKQLKSESESSSNCSQYKLVLVDGFPRTLCDEKTAKQEQLGNGDSAMLLRTQGNKPVSSLVKDGVVSHDAPTMSAINRATENLPVFTGSSEPVRNSSSDLSSPAQVEQTFRKVLLALLELSYKFMHFEKNKQDVNEDDLKDLMAMGFSEEQVRKALVTRKMDRESAMEWLIGQNGSARDEEQPSHSTEEEAMEVSSTSTGRGMRTRSRTFTPNPVHLSSLMEMGFSKEVSIRALKINGNDVNIACEWLLSDHPDDIDEDEEDEDEALNPNSELYKALISNPTIHIGLHDKKVLEALEDMVENPWRRNNWAYESAVGNVLLQILKLYNKYSSTAPSS